MTANPTKMGSNSGAGEYYIAGQMVDLERLSGKEGLWAGDKQVLQALGITEGSITPETWRCIVRGIHPSKAKVAFHPAGEFNPEGYIAAAWAEASEKKRKVMLKELRKQGDKLGFRLRNISVRSSAEALGKSIANAFTSLTSNTEKEKLEKTCFKLGARLPGFSLVQNPGPGRQTGYDITLTQPKDFSVLWARATDDTRAILEQICRESADESVLGYINEHIGLTRAGDDGTDTVGAKFISASFLDFLARPVTSDGNELPDEIEHVLTQNALGNKIDGVFVDAFIHMHYVIPNIAYCADGKMRAIDGQRIFQAQGAIGQAYITAIADKLVTRLGLRIERTEDGTGWKILDVPRDAVDEMGKRTQVINAKKDALGISDVPNRDLGQALWDMIAKSTRGEHITFTNDQVNAHLKGRLDGVGFTEEDFKKIIEDGKKRLADGVDRPALPTKDEILEIAGELLKTESVFSDHKLRAVVLGKFILAGSPDEIIRSVDEVIASDLINLGEFQKRNTLTNIETIGAETVMLDIAEHGIHDNKVTREQFEKSLAYVAAEKIKQGKQVSEEQAEGAWHQLSGNKTARVLIGPAGSGKTFSMEIIQHALNASGYTTVGAALTWSASDTLKFEGGLNSASACAKLAHDIQHGKSSFGSMTALVLDEGSLIDVKTMSILLKEAHEKGSMVIITGDTEQIQAVGAGAAMRAIVERIGAFEFQVVRRQEQEWDRQAGLDIRRGGEHIEKGILAHAAHDRIHVVSGNDDAMKALFERWKSDRQAFPSDSQMMISKNNVEVDQLNDWARKALHESKLLGEDHEITVKIGKETKQLKLAVNDFIQFRFKSKTGVITDESDVDEQGRVFNRTRAAIKDIKVDANGIVCEIKAALYAGDKPSGKTMTLKPEDFTHDKRAKEHHFSLEHAYAVTSSSAQGATVHRAYVLPGGMGKEHGYVSLTRHRKDCQIFVSRDEMHKQAARYMDRTKYAKANQDGYIDRNKFTDAMAIEGLIAQMSRSSGKKCALDYVSGKSQIAAQSCLAGTRFADLVKTDEALMKTWQHIDATRRTAADIVDGLKNFAERAKALFDTIVTRNVERAGDYLKSQGFSMKPSYAQPAYNTGYGLKPTASGIETMGAGGITESQKRRHNPIFDEAVKPRRTLDEIVEIVKPQSETPTQKPRDVEQQRERDQQTQIQPPEPQRRRGGMKL